MLAGLTLSRGQRVEAAFADDLAAMRMSFPDPPTFLNQLQHLARRGVWTPLVARARKEAAGGTGIEQVEGRLKADLEEFRAALRRGGVDASVSTLGLLPLAGLQWEQRRLDALEVTLREVGSSVTDPSVPPQPVGEYWQYRGLLESERANFSRAREHFETALGVWRKAGLPEEAVALGGLGQLLLRLGDYPAADEQLREAVRLHQRSQSLRGTVGHALALRNLADAVAGLGQQDEATQLRQEALKMAESIMPPDPYALYLCRNSLGGGAYRDGRFAEARAEFARSLEVARRSFGAKNFHVAEAEVNLAWVDLAQGHPGEALVQFQDALVIIRDRFGEEHPRFAEVLAYVARLRAERGDHAEANRLLTSALELRQRHLDRLLRSAFSERDRLALVQELRVHPESSAWPGVFDTFLELAPAMGIPPEEQYRRILVWKGILTRQAPPAEGDGTGGGELADLERRRREIRLRLRNVIFFDKAEGSVKALEAEEEDLERRIRAIAPQRAAKTRSATEVTSKQVAAALRPGAALLDVIEIRRYRPRRDGVPIGENLSSYVAILSRPGAPPVRIDFGDAAYLDEQIRKFEPAITRDDTRSVAEPLARAIQAPLLPYLDGVETLVVAADGLLHRLPMGALPGRRPGTYWVEDLAFAFVPTAQSFLERRRSGGRPTTQGALVVGGVDYGPPTESASPNRRRSRSSRLYTRWPALPATLKEADEVATVLRNTASVGRVEVLTGREVSKGRIRDALPHCRYAHLATHGSFSSEQEPDSTFGTYGVAAGFDSFLVLADANRVGVDALMTAGEIEALDLRGVELVVLSSCKSGLGHIRAGQGVIGLPGAMDRAGVSAVVSTLWSVEDEATRAFMAVYYKHLWGPGERKGPGHALCMAQRDMIRRHVTSASGVPLDQPFQWAAFVLDGDPFVPPAASPATQR